MFVSPSPFGSELPPIEVSVADDHEKSLLLLMLDELHIDDHVLPEDVTSRLPGTLDEEASGLDSVITTVKNTV